jgi:hypothetical protein
MATKRGALASRAVKRQMATTPRASVVTRPKGVMARTLYELSAT